MGEGASSGSPGRITGLVSQLGVKADPAAFTWLARSISSLAGDRLTPAEWLKLVRMHWGVENNCHNTWDTAFEEDDRRWIVTDPKGAMNVMLLRRLAYNMLALFRSVTQRSEEKRMTQWKDLLRWVYNTLIAAQETDLAGLRERTAVITEI